MRGDSFNSPFEQKSYTDAVQRCNFLAVFCHSLNKFMIITSIIIDYSVDIHSTESRG